MAKEYETILINALTQSFLQCENIAMDKPGNNALLEDLKKIVTNTTASIRKACTRENSHLLTSKPRKAPHHRDLPERVKGVEKANELHMNHILENVKFAYVQRNEDGNEACEYRNYFRLLQKPRKDDKERLRSWTVAQSMRESKLTTEQENYCGRLLKIQKELTKPATELHAAHKQGMIYAALFCEETYTSVYVGKSKNGTVRWSRSSGHFADARDLVNSESKKRVESPPSVALHNYPAENIYVFVVDCLDIEGEDDTQKEAYWISNIDTYADKNHEIDVMNKYCKKTG
eukprot:TRINITY_DN37520_c0_g1_i1.p1 TRINITY_DN37520_c0_g1~~TRINITY_DN37520_c0_g1_i1.p1  ORF type:complete len:289 (+),score=30.36 TRINITY_DN37520_c0_g1_i1:53-919(+)